MATPLEETTKEGNYSKKLRKKIGSNQIEIYWDGDAEAKGKKFFSTGDLEVSYNDEMLAYSIDDKGGEYFTIFLRRISDNKLLEEPIKDTAGGIVWSYDDKSFFYRKHDSQHRARKIFQHIIGTSSSEDKLISNVPSELSHLTRPLTDEVIYLEIKNGPHTPFKEDCFIPNPYNEEFMTEKEYTVYLNQFDKLFS